MSGGEDIIPWGKPSITDLEINYVTGAIESGWVSGGQYVDQFEERFAELIGADFALAVSSGTAALHLALKAIGIGPGDEVIVPGYSFVASANSVTFCGANPVFCDIDPDTWLVDLDHAETLVGPATKALMVVHLHGAMPDMNRVREFTKGHSLHLIEDVAQGLGSRFSGHNAGSFGVCSAFSFQATKTMTTGEGGMVVSSDPTVASEVRLLREHGLRERGRYYHEAVGFNYRLTNLQAALGCAQLDRFDSLVNTRVELDLQYRDAVTERGLGILQARHPAVEASPFAFPLIPRSVVNEQQRDALIGALADRGIESRPGWHSAPRLPIFDTSPLPVADRVSSTVLLLPLFSDMVPDDVTRVLEALEAILS
jgi:perosamine synthetase